jgi:hypothetical protein
MRDASDGAEPPDHVAARVARAALLFDDTVPAEVLPVGAAGQVGPRGHPAYVLVVLGDREATVGLAVLDAGTLEPLETVRLPGQVGHVTVDATAARQLAGLPNGEVRLVWAPSRRSRSRLYPFWQVAEGGRTTYVDLQGRVAADLGEHGRGG